MIKRTIYLAQPAYMHVRNKQLLIEFLSSSEQNVNENESVKISHPYQKNGENTSIPIEDIGIMFLDHPRIVLSQTVLKGLMDENAVLVNCNDRHLPTGLMIPMVGHSMLSEVYNNQVSASHQLKGNLWKQIVSSKIFNQAMVLKKFQKPFQTLIRYAKSVKSHDAKNCEGSAAYYYWKTLLAEVPDFTRDRDGVWPNSLLNYGYAILRAVTARAIVSSGLIAGIGLHHKNKYNPYCLADDVMEAYRPYVDSLVFSILTEKSGTETDLKECKKLLLTIPAVTVNSGNDTGPLMVMMQRTTSSLAQCFSGKKRKLHLPLFQ